jgi:hypothetical protein
VWLTEVAVYSRGMKKAGDPVAAAQQRIKAFFRGFIYRGARRASTLPDHGARAVGDRSLPLAREVSKVRPPAGAAILSAQIGRPGRPGGIAGYRDAGGELVSEETALTRSALRLRTAAASTTIEKQAMLGEREMDFARSVSRSSRRKLGFHLWSVHSESISFGELAAAYVEAVRMKLAEFFGNWLGLEYRPETRVPQWQELGKRNAWSYNARGFVPAEAWFLTAASMCSSKITAAAYRSAAGRRGGRAGWSIGDGSSETPAM